MAERNTPDRRNLMPLAGSIVAGTGIIALAYKALFTKGEESEESLVPAPAAAAAAAPVAVAGASAGGVEEAEADEEAQKKPKWPCSDEPDTPCSNPYSRRTPYCQ
ncbi:unnamed protein product [Chrysodeixis includens]|uniref:Uncharacterized protein n=1 Tax=Chrysodeixis includens TaxID=689277 RepID=A0A9P0C3V5_CHRIL|nr:unnamed protein product [Chrysodeixis includens]